MTDVREFQATLADLAPHFSRGDENDEFSGNDDQAVSQWCRCASNSIETVPTSPICLGKFILGGLQLTAETMETRNWQPSQKSNPNFCVAERQFAATGGGAGAGERRQAMRKRRRWRERG